MDPKLAYWTAAFVNMTALMGFAVAGVRHVRRGEVARHQRAMKIAGILVLLFLASYPLKLAFLGREDTHAWSSVAVWVLRVHELCVAVMLLGGLLAFARGRRLARTRAVRDEPDAPSPASGAIAAHRGAGRVAVGAVLLAWATAGAVLVGMYGRG